MCCAQDQLFQSWGRPGEIMTGGLKINRERGGTLKTSVHSAWSGNKLQSNEGKFNRMSNKKDKRGNDNDCSTHHWKQ